ncbi:DUF1810 family protein [Corticibacterium sp. UT-5YL-CI-8]|nr:DUF1810 family protein [Tianweitania sp. UT-5YL-CI-8]
MSQRHETLVLDRIDFLHGWMRLEEVEQLGVKDRSLQQIFGSPDDLKFHSSMTLFALASSAANMPFHEALDRWFGGRMDGASLRLLEDLGTGFG